MSEQSLILRNDQRLEISFTPDAQKMKEEALASSALVGQVTTAEENASAVQAQVVLKGFISTIEKAEAEAKRPLNEFKDRIIKTCRAFRQEAVDEMTRISTETGSFQQLEQAKARAAEQARNMELSRLEREKAQAMTQATSHESADAIAEYYNRLSVSVPVHEPVRAEGQRVVNDWEISVTNPYDLAKFHPACVKITPMLSEIKSLLNQGITVKGITATKIVKAGVRLGAERKAIDV